MDLWALVRDGPEQELNKTVNTQPAMLTAGVGVVPCLAGTGRSRSDRGGGSQPGRIRGPGCGGRTGLCRGRAARCGSVRRPCRKRSPKVQGAIAAILGLDDEAVRAVCREARDAGMVEAANFNSPGQVVIAGQAAGVQRAIELAKARGAKRAVLLPMSVPSHCSLMRPAAERLRERLARMSVQEPAIRGREQCGRG